VDLRDEGRIVRCLRAQLREVHTENLLQRRRDQGGDVTIGQDADANALVSLDYERGECKGRDKELTSLPWKGGVEKNTTSGQALYLPVRQALQAGCEQGTPASMATRSPAISS